MNTESDRQNLTILIDGWLADPDRLERTLLWARDFAARAVVVLPAFDEGTGKEADAPVPAEWIRVPWAGSMARVRNAVLATMRSGWCLVLNGDEEVVRMDAPGLWPAMDNPGDVAYRLAVEDRQGNPVRTDNIRLFTAREEIRYTGAVGPQVSAALAEFGYPIKDLEVRVLNAEPEVASSRYRLRRLLEWLDQESGERRDGWVLVQKAMVHMGLDNRLEAMGLVEHALKRELTLADFVQAQWIRAGLLAKADRWREVRQLLSGLVDQCPRSNDLTFLYGVALVRTGAAGEAAAVLARSVKLGEDEALYSDPGIGSYWSRLWLARAYLGGGREKDAIRELVALIRQFPRFRSAWQTLLHALQGNPPQQIMEFLLATLSLGQIQAYFSQPKDWDANEKRLYHWLTGR